MLSARRSAPGPSIPHVTNGGDAGAEPPVDRPWTRWPVGARVVVRRRLAEGGYSDVLGYVVSTGDDGVTVETRTGEVHVPAATFAVGKLVPPPPPPRAPRR